MNAVIHQIFQPNVDAMRSHVEHLFGGYLDGYHEGKIELAWTDSKPDEGGRYRLAHARLFGTEELDELIAEAARLNSTPMCNVYIGAALRHPNTAPFGRAKDQDAWALTCAYVDLDDPGAATAAKDIYGADKPTMVVVTGREPHVRAQLWWRLDEPLTLPERWPNLLRGIATKLNADSSVTNPSRVMRLAGTIAWPAKPGRSVELTNIAPLKEPGEAFYAVEHLAKVFPPASADAGPAAAVSHQYTTNSLGLADKIIDGREAYMRNTISACLIEYIGETGAAPTPQELVDVAWPQYERKVDLTRSGRGAEEFARKCAYTVERFNRGEIRGIETLDKAIEVYRRKRQTQHSRAPSAPQAAAGDVFQTLSLTDIEALPPPTWLVDGLIPETGLTFLYGKPGKGKSFVALDLALRVAHGLDWHGKECRPGGVLYIAGEGKGGYRNRVRGWHLQQKIESSNAPFHLLPHALNFMDPGAVDKLVRTVQASVGNAKLVVVDTVARVLPGAEENASKEMGLFVAACDAVRWACGVAVIGVHHSGKDEERGMRGSSSLEGAGDCVLHIKRVDESPLVEIITEKQKDGEQGRPLFLSLTKVDWMDGLKQASTLVPVVAAPAPNRGKWPDRDACRRVLDAIKEAWSSGKPWSFEPQSKRAGRYGPKLMGTQFHIGPDVAEDMIETWLMNDILSVEVHNSDTKMRGLKVVGNI